MQIGREKEKEEWKRCEKREEREMKRKLNSRRVKEKGRREIRYFLGKLILKI